MIELSGRVALVTGASRGIGAAIARRLASQGARVVAAARADNARPVAEDITRTGGQAEAMTLDVTDGSAAETAMAGILERHGRIDILVNNAGIARDQLLLRMNRDDWDAVLTTNPDMKSSHVFFVDREIPFVRYPYYKHIVDLVGDRIGRLRHGRK